MNIFWLFLIGSCLLTTRMSLHADFEVKEIWNSPEPVLERITGLIAKGNFQSQERGALAPELQTLAYAISQEIMAADSLNMLTPSSQRTLLIKKWADVLAPYTEKLVLLALDPKFYRTQAGGRSRTLLNFAPATEQFAQQVRPYLEGPKDVPLDAARLLFEHRLLTNSDKIVLSAKYKNLTTVADQGMWAEALAEMGMKDGLDYVEKSLLAKPLLKTGENFELNGSVLRTIFRLGPLASSQMSNLKQYFDANIQFAEENNIEYFAIINAVQGSGFIPPIAINGSGSLAAGHTPAPIREERAGKEPPKAVSVPLSTIRHSAQSSSHNSVWRWLLSALAVAILVLLVRLAITRRRNSKAE